MLFNANNGMQKAYVYINNEDFVNFLSKNSKSQAIKIDLLSIKSYLRSKGFNGFILKKSKNLYVILNEKSADCIIDNTTYIDDYKTLKLLEKIASF